MLIPPSTKDSIVFARNMSQIAPVCTDPAFTINPFDQKCNGPCDESFGFIPSKALPNICVQKTCPHDMFPCAGFLCIPMEEADAGRHLVCLSYLIQFSMNYAVGRQKIGEFWKASYETRIGGSKMKKLQPLRHAEPAVATPKNDFLEQTFNNVMDYAKPSVNDITDTLVDLYQEDSNGGYFDFSKASESNSQQDNGVGQIIVMTHVATAVAQAALGFVKDGKKIFDGELSLMDSFGNVEDVQEFLELVADNPLGIKYCKDTKILIP